MLSEVLPARDDRSSGYLDDQLRKEKQYWLEKLSGELQPAGLPLDRPRPAVWSGRTDVVHFVAEPETADRLREICGGNDALAFTAIVAALKICLRLYSGIDDVCIGTAIHERYTELASLNKFLVLRDRVEGAMTARQLLASVKRTLSEAYAHQKYPFDKLSQILNTESPANRCQFFDVVALFDRLNNRENCDHLKNDVTLLFSWRGRDLVCDIEYRPALFDRANIETFSDHFRAALRAILWQPDKQIGQVELLSPERRERILVGFNETQREYNRLATIHQLFERQARRVPEAIAVVHGQQPLTYQQLNNNANQLAHRLRRLGVMPGQRVGICLHHSPTMLTAILAVLKAGGAYVPFDPAHPAAGIAAMLADARPTLLLTESALAGKFASSETPALLLDVEAPAIAQEVVRDLPRQVTGDDLAYIIYTSGSTGEPKGVMIRHNSLVNYICWASEVYLKGRSLDFALYSSLAFDLTVTSVYAPLVTGNAVRIYSPENRVMALPEILEDGQSGVLKLTPSHLSLIKERDNRGSGIRTLIVGGEALETALAKRIQESFGGEVEIFNEYGPTEATVGCMIYKFDAQTDRREFVPIGGPAANTQIYVL
ncbi:MAG: AMP-binding protein, partial [Acidobacteriota bacterium]